MIDLGIVSVTILCCCLGVISGAVMQIISISSVVGGVIATYLFAASATQAMLRWTDSVPIAKLLAYLGVFFCASLTIRVLGACIYSLVQKAKLKKADRIGGALIGAVKALFISAVVVVVLTRSGSVRARSEMDRSYLARPVVAVVDYVLGKADEANLTEKARDILEKGRDLRDSLEEEPAP